MGANGQQKKFVITTWEGGRAEQGGNCVAAATKELHAEAMAVLKG